MSLRIGGLAFASLQQYRNYLSIKQKGAYRILCLGESTTANQYPAFLENVLNQRNIGIKFSVIDKGVPATNTSFILEKLESNLDAYHPDMVITMMGINDLGPHMPCEAVFDLKAIKFFKSFRTYKLTRLLWLHIVTRFKALTFDKLSKHIIRFGFIIQRIAFQQVYAQEDPIGLSPQNDSAYIKQGLFYKNRGNFLDAEVLFKNAVGLNLRNDLAYVELGRIYIEQYLLSDAEAAINNAIELNPRNDQAYVELGRNYRNQGKPLDAEASFKKAIELNPKNGWAFIRLGQLYQSQGKIFDAEASFRKAIEAVPKNDLAYVELGQFYREQGRLLDAEAPLKKAIEINAKNDRAYGALELLYMEMGNSRLEHEYNNKATELRLNNHQQIVADNHHKLKAILDNRGITFVCAQYPMRNLEPLKGIFRGNTDGIIFVDNERIFKDALKRDKYSDYFLDSFGGDFGHCTQKGNRLLAENIANIILKEVFGK